MPALQLRTVLFKEDWDEGLTFATDQCRQLFIKNMFTKLDGKLKDRPALTNTDETYKVSRIVPSKNGFVLVFDLPGLNMIIYNKDIQQADLAESPKESLLMSGFLSRQSPSWDVKYERKPDGTILLNGQALGTKEVKEEKSQQRETKDAPEETTSEEYEISDNDVVKVTVTFLPGWDKGIRYVTPQSKETFCHDICAWLERRRNKGLDGDEPDTKFFVHRASLDETCLLHISANDVKNRVDMFSFKNLKPDVEITKKEQSKRSEKRVTIKMNEAEGAFKSIEDQKAKEEGVRFFGSLYSKEGREADARQVVKKVDLTSPPPTPRNKRS